MWKVLLLAAIFACDAVDFKCKRGCEAEYRDILRKYKSKYDDIDMGKVKSMAMKYKQEVCFPTCGVFYYVNEDEFEVAEPADEFSEEELNDSSDEDSEEVEDSESELAWQRKKKVPVFNCFTKDRWSTEKKDWCCANMDLGCSKACKTKERWSDKKKDWCCANMKLGCRKAEEKKVSGFNCYTRDRWSDERRDWCCANKNLGCPKVKKPAFDCRTKERWSTEKKAWCWSNKKANGGRKTRKKTDEDSEEVEDSESELAWRRKKKVSGFNCYTRDWWSDERRDWCCANMNLGCPKAKNPAFNCTTKERWSTEKKAWCWSNKKANRGKKTRKKTEEMESDWGNGSGDKYCYKYSKPIDRWSRNRVVRELKKVKC